MKMYKETLKKLSLVGIPLAVATLLYTFITGGQDCFGQYTINTSTSAIGVTPVLVYYVFTAVLFAFYGFSFLFKRSASDLYHSLPVPRADMYLSVTLATATWMGATIVLNVLSMTALLLIGGCPFVPAYIPLLILFYFVASMLVFAAAAVGCALSGSYVTALASTGLVLFLPRFVQFIFARGLVANVSIIGWTDLGALLSPLSNVATGLLVMQSRNMFIYHIVSMPYILYSLLLAALELALGAWLFMRRPSETAERGATNKGWAVATACLLAFALLLMITVDSHQLFSVYGAAITAVALLGFVLYGFISLRSVKGVLKSLPFFLLSAALAFCVSLGIDSLVDNTLSVTPTSDEIASISFNGHDSVYGNSEYVSILLRDISFTNDDLKRYVSENLTDAVEDIKAKRAGEYSPYGYSDYNQNQVIEPITLRLTNGRTIRRTIEFANVNTLNGYREENEEYCTAIRSFPPDGSVQYLSMYSKDFTEDEMWQIWEDLNIEAQASGLIVNDYYEPRETSTNETAYTYDRGGEQSLLSFFTSGYVGTRRFSDYYKVRLSTPDTASLLMRTTNKYAKEDSVARLADAVKHIASALALDNDYLSLSVDFYNAKLDEGEPLNTSFSIYVSGYTKKNETHYAELYLDYAQQLMTILKRGEPTDDSSGMFLRLDWYEYDSSNSDEKAKREPDLYLGFSDEDEAALITLLQNWQTDTMYGY